MAKGEKGDKGALQAGEEAWMERLTRLQERFPNLAHAQILKALRANDGHAGYAAADLRDLEQGDLKEADPDDSEWVATLLSNPMMFKATCMARFRKFDVNRNGTLEWPEVVALAGELSCRLGLEAPSEKSLRSFFFDVNDENKDGVLSEKEFTKFFESFLRYAFFMEHRRLVGTWRYQPDPASPLLVEYKIVQTKDWRLQFRCVAGACPGGPRAAVGAEFQEVAGTLELQEGWLQAELKQGVRVSERRLNPAEPCGCIRMRLADATGDLIVSSYRANQWAEWGAHVLGRRGHGGRQPGSPSGIGKRAKEAWMSASRPLTPC